MYWDRSGSSAEMLQTQRHIAPVGTVSDTSTQSKWLNSRKSVVKGMDPIERCSAGCDCSGWRPAVVRRTGRAEEPM
jgi:hypothetical protein